MSSYSTAVSGGVTLTNFDLSKLFIKGRETKSDTYTNNTGSEATVDVGTIMGRITSSGKLIPFKSDAVDGSERPVGVLAGKYTVANGEDKTVLLAIGGWLDADLYKFAKSGDDLDTAVDGVTVRDHLMGNTMGIKSVTGTEFTSNDNQ